MKKLKKILLIDDDLAINFLHKHVINSVDCAESVIIKNNGKEAINYLKEKSEGEYPNPELIFLDINMPVMDGWEFLKEYEMLLPEQQGKSLIVMLSTSLNPDDEEKSKNMGILKFINKPLAPEILKQIIETCHKEQKD